MAPTGPDDFSILGCDRPDETVLTFLNVALGSGAGWGTDNGTRGGGSGNGFGSDFGEVGRTTFESGKSLVIGDMAHLTTLGIGRTLGWRRQGRRWQNWQQQ